MTKTRLGLEGFGVRRAGSFAAKFLLLTLAVNPKWASSCLPRGFATPRPSRSFAANVPARTFVAVAYPSLDDN